MSEINTLAGDAASTPVIEISADTVPEITFADLGLAPELLRAVLDGAGIGSQPMELAAPYLNTGKLVRVLAPWTTGQLTLYAALPSRKFLPARTQAFLEYLTEHTRNSVHAAMERANQSASPQ